MQTFVLSRILTTIYSGVGRRNRGNVPPPETEKIVVEIWRYLPEVILSEQRAESIEKFREKL